MALRKITPPAKAGVFTGSADRADRQRAYLKWTGENQVPAGWEVDGVSVTPPAGWYRVRLWTSEPITMNLNGVGISADVPVAHSGLSAPAVDMICKITGQVNIRYVADRQVEYRMEISPT